MSETGDPANPRQNPPAGNPDLGMPEPDKGETGDESNPKQNPPAPNPEPQD